MTRDIRIPYSTGYITAHIEEERIKGILVPRTEGCKLDHDQARVVSDALVEPAGSARLREMAVKADKVLIVTSDHTRPVPSRITMPLLLEEIRSINKGVKIKILIATGSHRASTADEIREKFGDDIAKSEEIINHDCRDIDSMIFKGMLPSGSELWLNGLVDWADVIVAEGFIEPHFFAGFSGGGKSILPGIAAARTVYANHCSRFIADENARTGNLNNNPIYEDIVFAAGKAKLGFILNVAINSRKEIIGAFAGNYIKAHKTGCDFVERLTSVNAVKADVVITSNGGHPLDRNIYQAVKGMTAAEACVKEGGVIIIAASCIDGHGGEGFYRLFADRSSPEETAEFIENIPMDETVPDQWEAQILARVLKKARVILVTDKCSPDIVKDMKMMHACTIDEAMEKAEAVLGSDSDIVIIPDGVGIIIKGNTV